MLVSSFNFIESGRAELLGRAKSSKELQWKIRGFLEEASKIILTADVCSFEKSTLSKNHGGFIDLFSKYTCIGAKS